MDIKDRVEIIESILKSVAVVIGGIWVYLRFIRNRESRAKIEFNVGVNIVGRQNNKILIEVCASLENKGLVRHRINKFTCDVLILRTGAPVVHGDKRINYQLLFEKHNPHKTPDDDRRNRIVRIPED